MEETEIQVNTLTSPFSNITEPTTVRRILLQEGLLDVHNNIVGDGFAFVPIECAEYWGLVIADKQPDGKQSCRIVTCHKSAGLLRMTAKFAEIMDGLQRRTGYGMRVKLESLNQN